MSAAGYDDALFPLLETLEPNSFWFRARNDLIVWALRAHFPSAGTLLEIGCGTGFVLSGIRDALPNLDLVGGELSEVGVEIARRRLPEVRIEHLDALELPYREVFDVVCAFDVLEHIEDDVGALAGLSGASRKSGGVMITVPQHQWLWSRADDVAHHARRYTRRELTEKMEAAGLRVTRITSFVSLLLPAMLLSRLRYKLRPDTYDLASELVTGRRATSALEHVMRLERRAIARGISFPVGGSLLAVAHKA